MNKSNFKGALFCDRDGVLIEARVIDQRPFAISSIEEIQYCTGVESALDRIKHKLPIIMVTNQPEIARGSISKTVVDSMNFEISRHLGLTSVYICPHDDLDNCKCRKPEPGLLKAAALDYELDLTQSFLIGDRWKDITCAQRAGVSAFYIDRSYAEAQPIPPFTQVKDMHQVVEHIMVRMAEYD